MKTVWDQTSLVSGETSPLLDARGDLAKVQSGVKTLSNMVVLAEGAATRRPGTGFIAALKDEARPAALVPFEAGAGDSYVLAINGGVIRFFRAGAPVLLAGAPYEIAAPFGDADLPSLRWTQSLDTMFIAWNGPPKRLTRTSDTSWSLVDYAFERGPVKLQNTDQAVKLTASAATGVITLTATAAVFDAGHVGSVWRIDEMNTGDIPSWKIAVNYTVGTKVRYLGRLYEVITAGDSGDTGPQHDTGDVQAGGASATPGCVFRFLCTDHGFVRITAVASGTSATGTVTQTLAPSIVASGSFRWSEGAWCAKNGWPSIVSIVDQSLLWGRRNEAWMSETTDIYGFEEGKEDDSSVSFRLFSPDGRALDFQWAMNAGSLLLGATSGEWVVRGPSSYDRITAANSRGFLQQSEGSAPHQPVSISGGAVFIGRARDRLNFAKFDFLSDRIDIQEFTTFSRHMLRRKAAQLAWQADPHRILWVRMEDGGLSAVTLRPDQEVAGWHRHVLPGAFVEQICAIQSPDARSSELWMQTRRVVNGATRRFIEQMKPFFLASDSAAPTAAGAWFLDCGKAYAGPPTTLLTGFGHLIGELVHVLTLQGDSGSFTVSAAGEVHLPFEVTEAVCGLPVEWQVKTLPIEVTTATGPSKGKRKTVNRVYLHLYESGAATVRASDGPENDVMVSGGVDFNAPYPLFSGVRAITLDARTERVATLTIAGKTALPFTLLGMTAEIDITEGGSA